MRTVLALALALAAVPAAAEDNRDMVLRNLGALSLGQQYCGIDVDRDAVADLVRVALPKEREPYGALFEGQQQFIAEKKDWTIAQRAAFCEATNATARKLNVLR